MATLTKQQIDEKVFNLILRLIEIKKDRAISNKDFKERIQDVEGEIEDLVAQGDPNSGANSISQP